MTLTSGCRWAAMAGLALLAGCQTAITGTPAADAGAALTGTVTFRERVVLPSDATVVVRLEDVTLADSPAVVLTEQVFQVESRQLPIPFELRFDPGRIDPAHRYAIRATIWGRDGRMLFTTTSEHSVLTGGAPSAGVEIVLESAS
jgi:putative lipoprotein